MASSRTTSYTHDEDIHLCHVYIDISQDPILGINQTKDKFWSRVETDYNNSKPVFITQVRGKRSLQCRMQSINAAVGKLRGCVRQIEHQNPSGASEQDILNRAKVLLSQDQNYKKGFKFDHVWPILKDMEKFTTTPNSVRSANKRLIGDNVSSESDIPTPESPTPSTPGLSSFSLNISDEDVGGTSVERPIGVRKAKLKKKVHEQNSILIDSMEEGNKKLLEYMKIGNEERQRNYGLMMMRAENEKKKLAFGEYQEDNKILLKDLTSVTDPRLRDFLQSEQLRIMEKRSQEQGQRQGQGPQNTSGYFGQYFNDIGGSGNDLPDY